MALYKAITHGKEKRKAYRGAKAFDVTCRNHGACDYCKSNRLFRGLRDRLRKADSSIDDVDFSLDSFEGFS